MKGGKTTAAPPEIAGVVVSEKGDGEEEEEVTEEEAEVQVGHLSPLFRFLQRKMKHINADVKEST